MHDSESLHLPEQKKNKKMGLKVYFFFLTVVNKFNVNRSILLIPDIQSKNKY